MIIIKKASYDPHGDCTLFECLTQPDTQSPKEVSREQAYQLLQDAFRVYVKATEETYEGVRECSGELEVTINLELDH